MFAGEQSDKGIHMGSRLQPYLHGDQLRFRRGTYSSAERHPPPRRELGNIAFRHNNKMFSGKKKAGNFRRPLYAVLFIAKKLVSCSRFSAINRISRRSRLRRYSNSFFLLYIYICLFTIKVSVENYTDIIRQKSAQHTTIEAIE